MFSVTKTLLNARLVACDGTEQVRTEIKLALYSYFTLLWRPHTWSLPC